MAVDLLLDRLQNAIADRYTIVRELGRGGMATVYLAQDIRNSRQVAVKVLGPELASAIGTGRFNREIEIAARLVHPHIVPLFESGVAEGLLYYVMPLIEGESLRGRLAREGALPVEDVVRIAREVGGALNFAHQHGFVHRDIKPENILLQAGTAYLADFGIALAVQGADQERLTNTGLSLGTPAYMSPEQASGDRRIDERSDIYSLGSVVYEMLAGDPPFEGSPRVVVARIMTERPVRLGAIRPTIPEAMSEVVGRAMAKMPADRFRTADEFVRALERAQAEPGRSRWSRIRVPGRWWAYLLGAGVAAGLLAAVLSRLPPRGTEPASGPRVDRQLTYSGDARGASLSPDGRRVSYLADHLTALVVRDLETGDSSVLVQNPGGLAFWGAEWSRDGSRLLYAGHHPSLGWGHYQIPVRGGKPELVDMNNASLTFGLDDTTYVSTYNAAYYIGSSPTTFQILPGDSVVGDGTIIDLRREVAFVYRSRPSPDGRWIASLATLASGEQVLLTLGRDGRHSIVVNDLGVPGRAVDDWMRPLYWSSDGGTIYFPRPQGLRWSVWSVRIQPETGAANGPPELVLERLPSGFSFGISGDGRRLIYSGGLASGQLYRIRLGPRGKVESSSALTTGTSIHIGPDISPDGTRVAYIRQDQDGKSDVFLLSIEGGQEQRLTSTGLLKSGVAWSPDGRSLAFLEKRKTVVALVVVEIANGRSAQVGPSRGEPLNLSYRPVWSPDGRHILYQKPDGSNYWVVDRTTGVARDLVPRADVGWVHQPVFSPDGVSVAVYWHRPPSTRFWIIGLEDGRQRQLPGAATGGAIRWGPDSMIYFQGSSETGEEGEGVRDIIRVDPTTGRSNSYARLPVFCVPDEIALAADARTLVCTTMSLTSDVWLSELPAVP
ncbi:MAG TPA: protein kinase [Gemmatimonadales bacterium]